MNWLKVNLGYSTEEIELIQYGLSAMLMEFSKFIFLFILFTLIGKPLEYLFGIFILLLLRTNTGGLHFSTYLGCLMFSTFILYSGCVYLPAAVPVSDIDMLLLLLGCITITYLIGPVVSKTRPLPDTLQAKVSRIKTFKVIFIYFIIVFLFPESIFIRIGFWIIMLQSAQLVIAYVLRKETANEEKTH
ncbi:MAG: accessory gene regulator B family protein [Bacteroidales bacterium]|nr:accessory gene regulator B family protein [Clostridium sp.]MCM1204502.1 accessory gene regulator B family protein [Bacteroidales bacterium]